MKEKIPLPPALLNRTPWESQSPIWPATSFVLHRNLAKTFFPAKMQQNLFQQTLLAISDKLLKSSDLSHPILLKAETLSPNDKEYIYEHFLTAQSYENTLVGQGFIIDDTGQFLAQINIQDHLQIQCIDCHGTWETAWNKLNKIETELGNSLEFAYSPRFGYLTSDPNLCGTGLIIQAYLHLPALIHTKQLEETLQKQKEEGLQFEGIGGRQDEFIGDILVLRNRYTLGLSEETILHTVHLAAMKWMAIEKELRAHLKADNSMVMKDEVCRAFGLLTHSYQLQTKEALDALSLIKLGLDLDWISGATPSKMDALFFNCQRAHLSHCLGETLSDPNETARKRAEFLHKQMQGIVCKIENERLSK